MASRTSLIELLAHDPELGSGLSGENAERARESIVVSSIELTAGTRPPLSGWAERRDLIGFMILEGTLLREIDLAGAAAAEVLGPGDLIDVGDVRQSEVAALHAGTCWSVLQDGRLAVLDERFSSRACRWPQVLVRVLQRALPRTQRLALALAIVHRRQVEARLLLMLWHLAHRFGRVRADGVLLELPLTHSALAKLVGAQRPSVTLALGALVRRGRLQRVENRGWLLPLPMPEDAEMLLYGRVGPAGPSPHLAPVGVPRIVSP
ncbi:MAG: helix-turn-helix domain-containing protein [Solirubrobacteraceae bacterium]